MSRCGCAACTGADLDRRDTDPGGADTEGTYITRYTAQYGVDQRPTIVRRRSTVTAGPLEVAAAQEAVTAGEQAKVAHPAWALPHHAFGSEVLIDPAMNEADKTAVTPWPSPPPSIAPATSSPNVVDPHDNSQTRL